MLVATGARDDDVALVSVVADNDNDDDGTSVLGSLAGNNDGDTGNGRNIVTTSLPCDSSNTFDDGDNDDDGDEDEEEEDAAVAAGDGVMKNGRNDGNGGGV